MSETSYNMDQSWFTPEDRAEWDRLQKLVVYRSGSGGRSLLSNIEKQETFIFLQYRKPVSCPNCATPNSVYEAARTMTPDGTADSGTKLPRQAYACKSCGRGLRHVVPLMGPAWLWHLVPVAEKPPEEDLRRWRVRNNFTRTDDLFGPIAADHAFWLMAAPIDDDADARGPDIDVSNTCTYVGTTADAVERGRAKKTPGLYKGRQTYTVTRVA